ncbi:MAG: DUF779 domain-containing protein [Chitinophagaceae bacterium]|nr:MAG: DUF779 domain-containing protein [Chitinophagaceae bacterium]
MATEKIVATPEAVTLIRKLKTTHGPLMFHQSGGCCDGSQPMCFAEGEFRLGGSDLHVGDVDGCGFYMSADQYEYVKFTQMVLDVSLGRGSSFSLEIPLGVRFIIRSRVFTDEEAAALTPAGRATGVD